jgi:adenosine deaminase
MAVKGYLYILECADGSYYTGSTKYLDRRLAQHQSGEGANHTRKRLPVKLVYYETFTRIDEAFYREKQIQGWSRKKKEALINEQSDELKRLAECRNETHYRNAGLDSARPTLDSAAFDSAQAAGGLHDMQDVDSQIALNSAQAAGGLNHEQNLSSLSGAEMSDFSTLPKIELHLHLDCSLSYKVVKKLRPDITEDEYRHSFVGPVKCTDLRDFLTRAQAGIAVMQTEESLRLVTLDLFEQLQADQVIYAEIRFAPLLHTEQGLTPEKVVAVINNATSEGIAQTGIQAGLILCTLRHFTEKQSLQTVRLVEQFTGTNVVGFDIAGDEAGFPVDAHIKAFQYAHSRNISCTAHAGEARGAQSVRETLRYFQPLRIGHGVRSVEDPELLAQLKAQHIHLEVCPTSNVQTNIYERFEDHRLPEIYQSGISMSINTDARTISNINLNREYENLQRAFQWEKKQLLHCNLEAVEHAFASEEIKQLLRKKILSAWK